MLLSIIQNYCNNEYVNSKNKLHSRCLDNEYNIWNPICIIYKHSILITVHVLR